MNTERILQLADHIEALPYMEYDYDKHDRRVYSEHEDAYEEVMESLTEVMDGKAFTMEVCSYNDDLTACETPACMAGHAVYLFAERFDGRA